MTEIDEHHWQTLERGPDVPLHFVDQATGSPKVLLRADDFVWIRQLLGDEPDAPLRQHPRTGTSYALLDEDRYERFKAFFEEDPLSDAEKNAFLRHSGKRAGWNEAIWNSADPT